MKQNDWVIANINNPTFDVGDFQNILDMNLSNTQLLDKEKYINNKQIRSNRMFQNESGEFSEKKFNDFYDKISKSFQTFSQDIDNYEYSLWDITRPASGKIKDINFQLSTEINPRHLKIGVAGLDTITESDKSAREYAQNSKIFDTASGKFLDKTVNNISLFENPIEYFKSLGEDPLVYATYDEDTIEIDPLTGRDIVHKKGDWKVNDQGEYYTEKLNGRSLIGKEVVSGFDYLTSENSKINKYDFFDSDDVEKSVGGTIMKNIAAIAPLFIPYVGEVYSGMIVSRELAKSLPMLYGIITGLTGQKETENKLLNTIAAYGDKFSTSTSDYAKQNIFAFENIGNLISDVATQWGQQSFIAQSFANLTSGGKKALQSASNKALNEYIQESSKAFSKYVTGGMSKEQLLTFTGAKSIDDITDLMKDLASKSANGNLLKNWNKTPFGEASIRKYLPQVQKQIERRTKIGQNLSLGYMAIISNTDVYDQVLQKNGTPFEAAAIALGSIIGMYSVDKFLGLGEMFFQNEPARVAVRQAARNSVDEMVTSLGVNQVSNTSKQGIINNITKGISLGKKIINNFDSKLKDNTLGIVGKSLGEGLEEVSEELVTDMSKTLGELAGSLGYFSQSDYGAWENGFERYAMSMLGGTIGGGIFGAKQAWTNRNNVNEFQNDLTYLLRNGYKDEVLHELKKLKDRGEIANTQLSLKQDENGTYLTAESESDSQNEQLYNRLVEVVNQLDFILNDNNLNLSDDQLFDNLVQGEYRAKALTDFLSKNNPEDVKSVSYITHYFDDFQKLTKAIVDKDLEISNYEKSVSDPAKRNTESYKSKIEKLKQEKQELLDQKEELFGEGSLSYVDKLLFAIDLPLSNMYLDLTYEQFVKSKGKDATKLTETEATAFKKEYEQYSKNLKNHLDVGYDLWKQIQQLLNPEIQKTSKLDQKELQDINERLEEYKTTVVSINLDEKFDFETDEEYQSRDKKLETEDEARFKQRTEDLEKAKINKVLTTQLNALKKLTSKPIDTNTRRFVHSSLGILRNKILDATLDPNIRQFNSETNNQLKQAYKDYYSGIINERDLKSTIVNLINEYSKQELQKQVNQFEDDNYAEIIWQISNDLYQAGIFDPYEGNNVYLSKGLVRTWLDLKATQYAKQISEDTGQEINVDDIKKDIGKYLSTEQVFNQSKKILPKILETLVTPEENLSDFLFQAAYVEDPDSPINDENPIEVIELPKLLSETELLSKDSIFTKLIDNLDNDIQLQQVQELDKASIINNPLIPLIDFISKNISDQNTEELLQDIYETYSKLSHSEDFELTSTQLQQLKAIKKAFDLAQNFIYAAAQTPSYNKPIGHNKSLNQFAKNHSDIFKKYEELPEIDEKVGQFLINEIFNYKQEIDSWIYKHEQNKANRNRRFENAEQNLIKTQLEFFNTYKDALKVENIDLLEGFDALSEDSGLTKLLKTHIIINKNYQKLKDQGKTDKEIIREIFKEDNKLVSFKDLAWQKLAKLDEHIKYGELKDYDKFQFIISSLALNDLDYYTNLLNYIQENPKFGPIAIQEHVSRLQQAQQNNPELINEALEWLKEVSGIELDYLPNTTISIGSAGSGKSTAVSAVSTLNGKDTWITGPTETQVEVLHRNLTEAKPIKDYRDLVYMALGQQKGIEFLNDLNAKNPKYFRIIDSLQGNKTAVLTIDDNNINTINDAPKYIVIDEATHIPTVVHSLLARFAKKNNINLQLLGDTNQNGEDIPNKMQNIQPEQILAWRTPKLFISLRDNNNQKSENLNLLNGLIEYLDDASTDQEVLKRRDEVLNNLNRSFLSYHTKTGFFGEMITNSFDPNIIPKDVSIAIITDKANSQFIELLSDKTNVTTISPLNVQGSEYDYVIIDTDLGFNKIDTENDENYHDQLLTSLKNLYTMISRSRKGSIITDISLLNFVKNKEDSVTGSFNITNLVNDSRTKRIPEIQATVDNLKTWFDTLSQTVSAEQPTNQTADNSTTTTKENLDNTLSDQTNDNSSASPSTNNTSVDNTSTPSTNNVQQINDDENLTDTEDLKEFTSEEIVDNNEAEQMQEENNSELIADLAEENLGLDSIRVYGNVSYSGIDTSTDIWQNNNESTTDLGIFLSKEQTIETPSDKYNIVKNLYELKSLFLFGSKFYPEANNAVTQKFSKDAIDNAEFWIVTTEDSNNERLIGLTTLQNDPNKKLINGKIVKLVAKIKGKDGTIYTVSLGGLANPKTWEANKQKIKDSINKRISQLEDEEKKTRLMNYVRDLDTLIENYNRTIKDITNNNKSYRINKPQFTNMTDLVNADYRLEDINSNKSQWDSHTKYAKTSDIYIEDGQTPGIKSSKGKAVIYVSSNPFIDAKNLRQRYAEQKLNPGKVIPDVRQIVLNNAGVSFESLMRDKYISQVYQRTNKGYTFNFPFENRRIAPKMYIALWNFRADLQNFLDRYNEAFNSDAYFKGYIEEQIISAIKQDDEEYNKLNQEYKKSNPNSILSEEQYRQQVKNLSNLDLIEKIWKFNDSLANSTRQFRLGYNFKHGAYLRKLTNLVDNEFQKKTDNIIGIYITPKTANDYLKALNQIFENVIDKVITPISQNPKLYIDKDLAKYQGNWFKQLKEGSGTINVKVFDEKVSSQALFTLSGKIGVGFPTLLVQLAKKLSQRQFTDIKLEISSYDQNGKEIKLDFSNIKFDGNPIVPGKVEGEGKNASEETFKDILGYGIYKSADGWINDYRYVDLFNLAFHGLFSTSRENDFETNDIRATLAPFKNGFYIDPVFEAVENGEKTHKTITNRKLFKANKIPGLPQMSINLSPYVEPKTNNQTTTQQQQTTINENPVIVEINNNLEKFGSKLSSTQQKKFEKGKLSKNEIYQVAFNQYFGKINNPEDLQWYYDSKDGQIKSFDDYARTFGEIASKEIDNGILKVHYNNSEEILTLQLSGNKIIEQIPENRSIPTTLTVSQVFTNVINKLNELDESIKEDFQENIDQLKSNLADEDWTGDQYEDFINPIIEKLNEYKEEGELDTADEIIKFINENAPIKDEC